jgi:hypothetical protein
VVSDQIPRAVAGVEVVQAARHEAVGAAGGDQVAIQGFGGFLGAVAADTAVIAGLVVEGGSVLTR